eukprot:scpid30764/ scgid5225/ Sperm flagellar protein 1
MSWTEPNSSPLWRCQFCRGETDLRLCCLSCSVWPTGEDIAIMLEEKEQTILELQETVQLMTVKVRRLEGLLRVKDLRIEDLTSRLTNMVAGASPERPPRRK